MDVEPLASSVLVSETVARAEREEKGRCLGFGDEKGVMVEFELEDVRSWLLKAVVSRLLRDERDGETARTPSSSH